MMRKKSDQCLLLGREGKKIFRLIALQVGDSLSVADDTFMRREEEAATTFRTKPRTFLGDKRMTFNGVQICLNENGGIKMQQKDKCFDLTLPREDKDCPRKCAITQYIGVNCRPEICEPVQLIPQGRELTTGAEYKTLNKVTEHHNDIADMELIFVPFYLRTSKLVLFTNALFWNDRDMGRQLGFLIIMGDEKMLPI